MKLIRWIKDFFIRQTFDYKWNCDKRSNTNSAFRRLKINQIYKLNINPIKVPLNINYTKVYEYYYKVWGKSEFPP